MGHHRRGRSTRPGAVTPDGSRAEEIHGAHRAGDRASAPRSPGPVEGVGARPLEDLVEAARTARRTGWTFGSEILASADTRGVPTPSPMPTPPPRDGRPRRYATHQPTAPIMVVGRS